ncbi:MAG TPA: response regulator transcription factor [Clostridia bacterium]|nr:response regulator transcription factor [Clostridia bacterium]
MKTRLRDVRVLVADDDALIRSALSDLIEGRPGLALVGTAGDAESAIALAISSRPDVAVLDYRIPGGGVHAAREITRLCPGTAVLCLSAYGDPGTASKMLGAGAREFLVKGVSTNEDIVASILVAARIAEDPRDRSAVE